MRMLLTLCAIGVCALALAVLVAGDRAWLLDLITFFWPVLVLAALAILVLTLPFGGTVARLAALAGVILCGVPFLMLPAAPDSAPGQKIRILTANVYIDNRNPAPFVALLTRAQPDIVVMQETRSRFADAVRGSGLYPFESEGSLASTDDKKIFSRYPLREQQQLGDLPGQVSDRHAMRLVVDSPAGPLILYAVHTDTPRTLAGWYSRNVYIERLATAIRAEPADAHVVIAGDWNLPAHSSFFRRFFAATGYRFARPGLWLPITRFATALARYGYFGSTIDHVAVSPNVRVTAWERGGDIGSNHLPVIVDLALPALDAVAGLEAGYRH